MFREYGTMNPLEKLMDKFTFKVTFSRHTISELLHMNYEREEVIKHAIGSA